MILPTKSTCNYLLLEITFSILQCGEGLLLPIWVIFPAGENSRIHVVPLFPPLLFASLPPPLPPHPVRSFHGLNVWVEDAERYCSEDVSITLPPPSPPLPPPHPARSFHGLNVWVEDAERYCSEDVPFMIVGNMADKDVDRCVAYEGKGGEGGEEEGGEEEGGDWRRDIVVKMFPLW